MAATYVAISREEFEQWLKALPYDWSRVQGKEGVYIIKFSPTVGVRISSSIGARNEAMGRGEAAVHMALVSLIHSKVINRKGLGQSRFNRTTNWKSNWKMGLDKFHQIYEKARDFYDDIASKTQEEREDEKAENLRMIEEIPGWEKHSILSDLHQRAQKWSLSEKQLQLVNRLADEARRRQEAPPQPAQRPPAPREEELRTPPPSSQADEKLVQKLRELYSAARARNDAWTMDFTKSVGQQAASGRKLSPRQMEIIEDKFRVYRIASKILRLAKLEPSLREALRHEMAKLVKRQASEIGRTVLEQLGGARRLSVMLGTRDIVLLPRGVAFQWPNRTRSKGNKVRIELTADDLYNMTFLNVAGIDVRPVKEYRGIGNDQLIEVFEKQTGWRLRM